MPAGALRSVPGAGQELEERYAADAWHAGQLGVPAARGRDSVTSTGIEQAWLRQAANRWARQRLSTPHAFNTIRAGAAALKRFSDFLADCAPPEGVRCAIVRLWENAWEEFHSVPGLRSLLQNCVSLGALEAAFWEN